MVSPVNWEHDDPGSKCGQDSSGAPSGAVSGFEADCVGHGEDNVALLAHMSAQGNQIIWSGANM